MKFCTDVHIPQRMNLTDFFYSSTMWLTFMVFIETSGCIGRKLGTDINNVQRMNHRDFGDLLTINVAPASAFARWIGAHVAQTVMIPRVKILVCW